MPRTRSWGPLEEWRARVPCILAAVGATLAAACDSGGIECQCKPTGLLLQVCPQLASQVQSIQLSGTACKGLPLFAVDAASEAAGTASYEIQPTQAGACGVEVSFRNGLTFGADQSPGLVVQQGPGCCSGFYPNGAREIEACVDAGSVDAEAPSDAPVGS
jgi:hypothetical protein